MKRRNKLFIMALITLMLPFTGNAQDGELDLMQLLEESEPPKQEKVTATFKTTRVINAHSIETVKAKTIDVRISHRFGNIYSTRNVNHGPDSFFGFDNVADVRLAVEWGITDELMVGMGRSQMNNLIDGFVKWRFLTQTSDNKIPISLAFLGNIGVNPSTRSTFYSGVKSYLWDGIYAYVQNPDNPSDPNDTVRVQTAPPVYGSSKLFFHRLSYTAQLIIARKFSPSISIELLPTYIHRNFVGNQDGENSLLAMGLAGRFKVAKRVAIIADYFFVFTPSFFKLVHEGEYKYDMLGPNKFHMPISIGVEVETGGHVFHIDISNAKGIVSNNFLTESPDSWQYAEIKLGFNISRVFNVGKRLKKAKEVTEG
ncbi:MAG TPA: hypothetical protein DCR04_12050 [Flavobacteriales bacterium]|nr:hypothetical protein [Flavobacteriales bacterium]